MFLFVLQVDRLVDLWVKYSERVRAAEEKMMQGEDAEEARLPVCVALACSPRLRLQQSQFQRT